MFSWVFKKTDMVRGQMIEENTRDHIIILFKSCKKTERRSQKLKTDDVLSNHSLNPYTYISAVSKMKQVMH